MDDKQLERMAEEYVRHSSHVQSLQSMIDELKKRLTEFVDNHGDTDDRGNQFLPAGRFMLRRQRRESRPTLDHAKVEEWAKKRGIWDQVSKTVEMVDEDALIGYIFDNRDQEGLEEEFQSLHNPAKVSFAFMKPVEEDHYEY